MTSARMLPGFGMVAEAATQARMLPGAGMVAETVVVSGDVLISQAHATSRFVFNRIHGRVN